ncbi:unnamed protein product [Echinostoma caproni]|uniref:VPS13 domain-containing protein n=1 Tax=Echinostoma caproni TaxID=27848 RepID=A0A183AN97_9TREM|nr:unnamed protein product [Echinostoma caproni]
MALAILKFSADKLLTADMESMVVYLQHEGPVQWEQHSSAIFESASAFKLNVKKLKKLEKEYLTMRSQEREDQIELRVSPSSLFHCLLPAPPRPVSDNLVMVIFVSYTRLHGYLLTLSLSIVHFEVPEKEEKIRLNAYDWFRVYCLPSAPLSNHSFNQGI